MPWNGPTFQTYYAQIGRTIVEILNRDNPDYLLRVDFEEYLDHLVELARWEPLDWYEDQMTIEEYATKVPRRNQFSGNTYLADARRFRLRIPVSRHSARIEYFNHGLSQTRINGEPRWNFEDDVLTFEVDASTPAVERGIEEIRFWLGGRNTDIERGNANLRDRIRQVWQTRRQHLEEQHGEAQGRPQEAEHPSSSGRERQGEAG